jgi:hypothetical protein
MPKLEQLRRHVDELVKQSGQQQKEVEVKTELANTYVKNCQYLEMKIQELMHEKEEQCLDLKSQIVLQKNKAKSYQSKLKTELEAFKQSAMEEQRQAQQRTIDKQLLHISELANRLKLEEQQNADLRETLKLAN